MYLNVLLLILSFCMLDPGHLSFAENSGSYTRIIVLIICFISLYVTEKNINRYLRKHCDE